ncbi:Hypp714 [Branchiostoma lanceolatum]|uniref:Hypp714 protein n=1 Tax=Branchiostoma lanceolatum TaxID=7740 RepID=A0A8J9W558_BRALA|nr:Hypp714 [Branchiostoma lanceolatum]
MNRYADKILVPYMAAQRQFLGLSKEQPTIAIFDVYKSHRCPALLTKLKDNYIHAIFVPASCTGELQPLDADRGDQRHAQERTETDLSSITPNTSPLN